MSSSTEGPAEPVGGRFVSIGLKLAGTTITVVAALSVCLYFALSAYERTNLMAAKESAAEMVVRLYVATAVAPLTFGDEKGVEDVVSLLAANQDIVHASAWALGPDGRSLGARLGELRRGEAARPPEGIPTALRGHREGGSVVVEAPVTDPTGKVVGAVQASFSLAHEHAAIAAMERRTLGLALAVSALLTVTLLFAARKVIVKPLARLVRAANALERGDSADLSRVANDEVGKLAAAFASMSSAISLREEHIAARNRDMRRVLDNAEEGFLAVSPDGRLSDERSLVLDAWFGPPAQGASLFDYLGGAADDRFGAWLSVGWSLVFDGFMPLEVAIDQLPTRFERQGRFYAVSYRPILGGDAVTAVLVVVRDVTERVERERAEERQTQMLVVFKHVLTNRADFDAFFAETARLVALLVRPDDLDEATLRRTIHTVKGNCAIFGLEPVARVCHAIENRMADGDTRPSAGALAPLRAAWAGVEATYGSLRGDGGPQLHVDVDEHRALLAAIAAGAPPTEIARAVASWGFERADARMKSLADQVSRVADSLGKGPVEVQAPSSPLRLPPARWAEFWSVFAHVVRNAVDHGIESPARRRELGKPESAVVRMAFEERPDEVVFRFGDDGGGIDWARLAVKARACGLPTDSREDLERALFTDSVTTRDEASSTSGRGVGMGAVLACVTARGGTIDLESLPGRGTTWTFRFPRSMLEGDPSVLGPEGAVVPPSAKRTSRAPVVAHVA